MGILPDVARIIKIGVIARHSQPEFHVLETGQVQAVIAKLAVEIDPRLIARGADRFAEGYAAVADNARIKIIGSGIFHALQLLPVVHDRKRDFVMLQLLQDIFCLVDRLRHVHRLGEEIHTDLKARSACAVQVGPIPGVVVETALCIAAVTRTDIGKFDPALRDLFPIYIALMLGNVHAKHCIVILARVDDLIVRPVEVFLFQFVDLNAFQRCDPNIVISVVDQHLSLVRVDLLFWLQNLSAQRDDKRQCQKQDHNNTHKTCFLSSHLTTCLFLWFPPIIAYPDCDCKSQFPPQKPFSIFCKKFIDKWGGICYYKRAERKRWCSSAGRAADL